MSNASTAAPETMQWDSRARRMVMLWIPLSCFLLILLFPFYWMTVTAFKPDAELYDFATHNPFWITSPTLQHIRKLLFETSYPAWLWTTMMVSVGATFLSLFASTLAAYAIQRLRFKGSQYVGLAIYLAYLVPPSILFIPLATMVVQLGLFDSPMALILVYPTFLVPFCTWLLIGYFKSIPYELEECALIDGATRLQILRQITLPLAVPFQATASDMAWLGLLGLTQLAIPCVLSVVCARVLKAPEVSLLALLEVIFGILLAWVGAGEAPGQPVLLGGTLVIGALVLNELLGWRARVAMPRIQSLDGH